MIKFLEVIRAMDSLDVPANETHIHESEAGCAYRYGEIYIGRHEITRAPDESPFDGIVPVSNTGAYGVVLLDRYMQEIALFSIT